MPMANAMAGTMTLIRCIEDSLVRHVVGVRPLVSHRVRSTKEIKRKIMIPPISLPNAGNMTAGQISPAPRL